MTDDRRQRRGRPSTHKVHFIGEHPRKADGADLVQIRCQSGDFKLAEGITAQQWFEVAPAPPPTPPAFAASRTSEHVVDITAFDSGWRKPAGHWVEVWHAEFKLPHPGCEPL